MYQAFLEIARELNGMGIHPLLMGSLGFEIRTKRSWNARDIDIHVPSDPRGWAVPDDKRIHQREQLLALMEKLGFIFTDPHEHEFQRDGIAVEFGGLHSLLEFAGVPLEDLEEMEDQGVRYYLPNLEQYLKIYLASSKDSYRAENNNNKDFAKIDYLKEILGTSNE